MSFILLWLGLPINLFLGGGQGSANDFYFHVRPMGATVGAVVYWILSLCACQVTTGWQADLLIATGYFNRLLSETNTRTGLVRWHNQSVWFARGVGAFFWCCGAAPDTSSCGISQPCAGFDRWGLQ